jgi:hypothetical protein
MRRTFAHTSNTHQGIFLQANLSSDDIIDGDRAIILLIAPSFIRH